MSQNEKLLNDFYARADIMMLLLLWGLFGYSLALAGWYDTWSEAMMIGLPAALVPSVLYFLVRGTLITRCALAAAFMIFAGLTIHQGHGMIELHFLIFVLLAFLLRGGYYHVSPRGHYGPFPCTGVVFLFAGDSKPPGSYPG